MELRQKLETSEPIRRPGIEYKAETTHIMLRRSPPFIFGFQEDIGSRILDLRVTGVNVIVDSYLACVRTGTRFHGVAPRS